MTEYASADPLANQDVIALIAQRNTLIENYIPLANKLAWNKSMTTPKSVDFEDLKSAAYYGLVDAARKYDTSRSISFGAYARFRIAGEMCDYLRGLSWGTRNDPFIPVSIDASNQNDSPLSDTIGQEDEKTPHEFFEKVTSSLGDVSRLVVEKYYIERYSLREIGEIIGVCESRVSQILTKARMVIRNEFTEAELLGELVA